VADASLPWNQHEVWIRCCALHFLPISLLALALCKWAAERLLYPLPYTYAKRCEYVTM
jgi:hypothetical protein